MKVAGFGFRRDVTLASLRDALRAAGGPEGLAAMATVSDKADAEPLKQLARECGVPIKAVPAEMLAGIATPSQSDLVMEKFRTGSVAEAAALAVAGPRARLIATRAVSQDRAATAAIAEGDGA
ncbi:cobalamin biosynthesis protein [Bradyrhizobium diazoefficiens]|uniref:cobalamin biosynthesis protein n=1 Tax=Bradyrhizobium sp. WYCCWR 12699 TaxID=3064203 RepID=UPI001B89F4E1|nr:MULTISPECIES: cobalamin biosynthesis protein [Bradyrhizobium]MBR0704178.1 cobalamin biosynthesis protein [Bradyrhizobium diazoefficiens]MBR0770793.1 cobalamin biosynthesis protein [Bradyrhizobium diazoefficiens]MBR0927944.1 cobalamin biosynthesis protein [Bradyrhizobium diazoefficiens]MDT4742716.1 cobalamin biosynthesis protein [Bradyrhizobium sp. WYCCWR 12699]